MNIKIIKNFSSPGGNYIRIGEILEARKTVGAMPLINHYQIIDGKYSGDIVPHTHCVEFTEEPKQDDKLVVLPVKVADAIEYYSKAYTKYGILDCILSEGSQIAVKAREALISKYGEGECWEVLMVAIVNGYTVETLESKIKAGVQALCDEWLDKPGDREGTQLSQRITDFVTQVIREEQS